MEIKKMIVKEFRELGLLQEINRQFLHPMGLALEVVVEDDGSESFGLVWDYRDDPKGMEFADGMLNHGKTMTVKEMYESKREYREKNLGYHIQPVKRKD